MARVTIYQSKVSAETERVARRVIDRVLDEIQAEAKRITAVGPYTSGDLALSIKRGPTVVRGQVITGDVGSDLPYAKFVHDGTRRHFIFPRGPWRLRFYWRRLGRDVAFWSVYHPGQKAKKFLTGPAARVSARYGWIVFTRKI